jgi:transposase
LFRKRKVIENVDKVPVRPHGSAKILQRRRHRAIALLARGLSMKQAARRVGVSVVSVWKWKKAVAADGPEALGAKPVPGRPRKLTEAQIQRLRRLLRKRAKAYGYPDDAWTLKRVAELIRREFGAQYHPGHVWRLLRRCR